MEYGLWVRWFAVKGMFTGQSGTIRDVASLGRGSLTRIISKTPKSYLKLKKIQKVKRQD